MAWSETKIRLLILEVKKFRGLTIALNRNFHGKNIDVKIARVGMATLL